MSNELCIEALNLVDLLVCNFPVRNKWIRENAVLLGATDGGELRNIWDTCMIELPRSNQRYGKSHALHIAETCKNYNFANLDCDYNTM